MIFKHKKLSESVVMREFEKVAIAKKMVKVEEPIITKEASASYQPSNNLIDDMLKLANGLRSRGFEKDASSLEEKVLTYKLAETHLYRAIDEDAEDMLEFAHPKKDKIVFDAANGDGEIEDTLSQHKKILDIVNKQPKKVAFDVLAETADILGLKKKADVKNDAVSRLVQTSDIETLVANINYLKPLLIKTVPRQGALYTATNNNSYVLAVGIGSTLWSLVEGINGNYFTPHESEDFEIKYLEFYRRANNLKGIQWQDSFTNKDSDFRTLFAKKEYVDHANLNLTQIYNGFKEKIEVLSEIEISDKSSIVDVNKFVEAVRSLIAGESWFALRGLTNNDMDLENKIRNYINLLAENGLALSQELSAKQPTMSGSGMDKILDPGFANIIAGRFESVADKDSDPAYFKQVATLIRANDGKPYKDLYTTLVQFDKDLASATDESKLDLIGQKWQKGYKIALNVNELIKEAKDVEKATFNMPSKTPATVPTTYNRPAGRNAGRSAVKEQSTFEKAFPDEFNAVATMQNSLQLLADNLDKFNVAKDKQTEVRNTLLGTGGVQGTYNGRVDGIWGLKTETALKEANAIFASHGEKEKLTTDAQRINGELQENHETKDVANYALANVGVFNKVLDSVGVAVDKNKDGKLDPNSSYLDSLPENVNLLQTDPKSDGDKTNGPAVNVDDLYSFSKLLQFIRRDNLVGATTISGFNYPTWEYILRWFYNRANFQAMTTKDPVKGKYRVLAQRLLEKLPTDFADKEKIISPAELDGSPASKAPGPTQNAAYKATSNTNADGTEVQNDANKPEAPPFGYEFNIVSLYKNYGHSMTYFDQYKDWLSIPLFNVNDFGYSSVQISAKYIKALTPQDILMLNGITNPNALIPGQTGTQYTYLNLMNSNVPAAIAMRGRANDYALLSVVNGLSRDLPAIMSEYVQNSPSDRYNKIIANAWDKWANNLAQTRSRINSDFAQGGQIPKVIF